MFLKKMVWSFFVVTVLSVNTNSLAITVASLEFCDKAVSSAEVFINARQQIALQRNNAEDITQAQYQVEVQQLDQQALWVSLENCMNSTEEQLAAYQCLVDNSGNVTFCTE